jgi:hypothetical protein
MAIRLIRFILQILAVIALGSLSFWWISGVLKGGTLVSKRVPYCDEVHLSDMDGNLGWDVENCRVHRYNTDDLIECFDRLSSTLDLGARPVHFAFMGDSRIRQIFHSFWPVIAFYCVQII